jgi:hypothetical protein
MPNIFALKRSSSWNFNRPLVSGQNELIDRVAQVRDDVALPVEDVTKLTFR